MVGVDGALSAVLTDAMRRNGFAETDVFRDGLRWCAVCGEPKQAVIDWLPDAEGNPQKKAVPVACKCRREAMAREAAEDRERQFRANMRELLGRFGIQPRDVAEWSFDRDEYPESPVSRVCREYVENWEDMRADGIGILLYGSTGTGKTVYASCIVNALLGRQVPAALVTVPDLAGLLQGQRDRKALVNHLQSYRLLALDDLGAERDTPYASELVFSVVDARKASGLPLVVTTNLDAADMRSETDLWRRRIYDRVLDMCPIALKMTGASLRRESADRRRERARELLRGAAERSRK